MGTLNWSDIIIDKDYEYALSEILHYSYTVQLDGAQAEDLAQALLCAAVSVMNYQDPWDSASDAEQEPGEARLLRLHNFCEYIVGYTDKRLALLKEGDTYMERLMSKLGNIKSTFRMLHSSSEIENRAALDQENVFGLLEDLEEDLLVQGISRHTLARAFVDCSFVFARLQPVDHFVAFCVETKEGCAQTEIIREKQGGMDPVAAMAFEDQSSCGTSSMIH